MSRDTIYSSSLTEITGFTFDERVVKVFPDMIERSVPGYKTIISAIGLLADRFARENSNCYDLGCSLGAATLAMRQHIRYGNCKIIAVDDSPEMIKRCKTIINADSATPEVEIRCEDVRNITLQRASVVVLNFTLQFIPLTDRKDFLQSIYSGMLPGGVLILSEKLKYKDASQQQLHDDMHSLFKKDNGYSNLEISQKRTALENVLIPETLKTHKQRLDDCGFSSSEVWFQYFNFASMIALKK